MAKSIFRLSSSYKGEVKSIKTISSELMDLIFHLKNTAPFDRVLYASDADSRIISIQDKSVAISELSQCILSTYKGDIKRISNEENIDANFSWDEGFRVSIVLEAEGEPCFSITGQLGCKSFPEINFENFKKEYSFDWYYLTLKTIVQLFNPKSASIDLNVPAFRQLVNEIEVWPPLGWVTYFSSDYLNVPDDLEGIEYEHVEKGKYLILTKEDFTVCKEAFQEQRDRLVDLMKTLKSRVPAYSES